MRATFYLWRGTARGSWRAILAVALIGGMLGAVALAALAGARRTDTAYGRYLVSSNTSDAFVNVAGRLPGLPLLLPVQRISALPGISSHATYVGMTAYPVVHGRVDRSFLDTGMIASLDGLYFRQDKLTVLAGRLPPASATGQVALTPGLARLFGVGVGGQVTYRFPRPGPGGPPPLTRSFRVAAIALIPPVLVDQADFREGAVLPPGVTRPLLAYYQYAWVHVRLARGAAGIPALQRELAGLATTLTAATDHKVRGISFPIGRTDVARAQVRQAIRPQVVALTVFGIIAALAMLVLTSQGLTQLLAGAQARAPALRGVGATRGQIALGMALPSIIASAGGTALAAAGAFALSPLAPVGAVRRYDPVTGWQADGLVLGAGTAAALVLLLGLLAILVRRAAAPAGQDGPDQPSAVAQLAASAGLPAAAVVGSRNALATAPGRQTVPAWVTVAGSVAAVTAVVITAVFGTSLAALITHPREYGWNWTVLIQAEGGYGSFTPGAMDRLVGHQRAVTAWSTFGFSQLRVDAREIPVLGLQRHRGTTEPPTTSGRPLQAAGEIELGTVTLAELGKKVGDTVLVGSPPHRRTFTIVGTVTLPSFGVAGTEHVSLGRGGMLSDADLIAVESTSTAAAAQPGSAPGTVAVDLAAGLGPQQRSAFVDRVTSADPDGTPGGTYQLRRVRGAAVADASGMGGQPLALALGLTAAAVLSVALTVLAGVRRRRQELALLKVLGMTRRQLRSIVAWQATVTLALTAVIAIPVGIAAGRWAWQAFASSLGVVPAAAVPGTALAAGLAGLLVAGNLLALLPAAVAARTPAATILRTD
jgi:hypothetical protein